MEPIIPPRHIIHMCLEYLDSSFMNFDTTTALTTPCGDPYTERNPSHLDDPWSTSPCCRPVYERSNFRAELVVLTCCRHLFAGITPYYLTSKTLLSPVDVTTFLILAKSPTVQYTQQLSLERGFEWENLTNDKLAHSVFKSLERNKKKVLLDEISSDDQSTATLGVMKLMAGEEEGKLKKMERAAIQMIAERACENLRDRFRYLRRLSIRFIDNPQIRSTVFQQVLPKLKYLEKLVWPKSRNSPSDRNPETEFNFCSKMRNNYDYDDEKATGSAVTEVFKQLSRLCDLEYSNSDNESLKIVELAAVLKGLSGVSLMRRLCLKSFSSSEGNSTTTGEMLKLIATSPCTSFSLEELDLGHFEIKSPKDLDHFLLFSKTKTKMKRLFFRAISVICGNQDEIHEKFSNLRSAFGHCLEELHLPQMNSLGDMTDYLYYLMDPLHDDGTVSRSNDVVDDQDCQQHQHQQHFAVLKTLVFDVDGPLLGGGRRTHASSLLELIDPRNLPSLESFRVVCYGAPLDVDVEVVGGGEDNNDNNDKTRNQIRIKFFDEILPRFNRLKVLDLPQLRFVVVSSSSSSSSSSVVAPQHISASASASILRLLIPQFSDCAHSIKDINLSEVWSATSNTATTASSSSSSKLIVSFDKHTIKTLDPNFNEEEYFSEDDKNNKYKFPFTCGTSLKNIHIANPVDDFFLGFLSRDRNIRKSLVYLSLVGFTFNNDITDRGLCELGRHLEKLRILQLDACNYITDEGIKSLFLSSSSNLHLREQLFSLRLSRCPNLTDKVFDYVSELPVLSSFDLTHNKNITGSTLDVLVKKCPLLERIDVSQCPNVVDWVVLRPLNSLCGSDRFFIGLSRCGVWWNDGEDKTQYEEKRTLISEYANVLEKRYGGDGKLSFKKLIDGKTISRKNESILLAYLENEILPDLFRRAGRNGVFVSGPVV